MSYELIKLDKFIVSRQRQKNGAKNLTVIVNNKSENFFYYISFSFSTPNKQGVNDNKRIVMLISSQLINAFWIQDERKNIMISVGLYGPFAHILTQSNLCPYDDHRLNLAHLFSVDLGWLCYMGFDAGQVGLPTRPSDYSIQYLILSFFLIGYTLFLSSLSLSLSLSAASLL